MTNANYHHRTMFECLDHSPQLIPGSSADTNGALFYHIEVKCSGIPCPPYDTQKEVTCTVHKVTFDTQVYHMQTVTTKL